MEEDSFDYRSEAEGTNEQEFDKVLRPKSLQDFSGQPAVVENLHVFVQAAKLRKEADELDPPQKKVTKVKESADA